MADKQATNLNGNSPEPLSSLATKAFALIRQQTDEIVRNIAFEGYAHVVQPAQVQLCLILIIDALAKLRCDLRKSKPGQKLRTVDIKTSNPSRPNAAQMHLYFCMSLLEDYNMVKRGDGGVWTRTATPVSETSANAMFQQLLQKHPDYRALSNLIWHAGEDLAEFYAGRTDGVRILFGSRKGRDLLDDLYGPEHHLSKLGHTIMREFMTQLFSSLTPTTENTHPLNILELGAGTGGTAKWLAPLLEKWRHIETGRATTVSANYIFSDIGQSFQAQAAHKFAPYSHFMSYTTLDITSAPPPSLAGTQDIVMACNVVHATSSIVCSLTNLRAFLRPGGFALVMELTDQVPVFHFVCGLLEGWYNYQYEEAGLRENTLASPTVWEEAFLKAGFGYVDWSQGLLRDSSIHTVFFAVNSG